MKCARTDAKKEINRAPPSIYYTISWHIKLKGNHFMLCGAAEKWRDLMLECVIHPNLFENEL